MNDHRHYKGTKTDRLEPLLSVREAAAFLGVSVQTVTRLIRGGELEAVRVRNRRLLVPPQALRGYLERAQPHGRRP